LFHTVAHALPLAFEQMIVTFLGTKGGTGTTTLAVNCAEDIRRLTGQSTLIVDAKVGPGDVSVFLGLRPRYSIVDFIDQTGWTNPAQSTRFLAEHNCGVHVLSGSDRFGRPSARDADGVDRTLRCLSRLYEFLVVDAGTTLTACAAAALTMSDVVMLVANPDMPCLRNLQRYGDALRLTGVASERVRVVLNRTSDNGVLPVAEIEKVLSRAVDHQLPSDYRTVAAALSTGVPVSCLHSTELHEQLTAMARSLVDRPAL
jgi:pilus assembly protein CpaE